MNKVIKFLCLSTLMIGSASFAMDHGAVALGYDTIAINNINQGAELRRAARGGNLPKVKALLAAGVPADAIDPFYAWYPINLAAWNNHEEICKLLIDAQLKPIKQIKQNKNAVIALLGMKKYRRARCMDLIDREVIQIIARQIYEPVSDAQQIQQLFCQINSISNQKIKEKLLDYAQEQLEPKTTQSDSWCTIA